MTKKIKNKKEMPIGLKVFLTIIVITICIASILFLIDWIESDHDYDTYESVEEKYYCDSEYTLLNNGTCYYKETIPATIEYKCFQGTLQDSLCIIESYSMPTTSYECPIGYNLQGFDCVKQGTFRNINKCNFNMTYDSIFDRCYSKIHATEVKKCYIGTLKGNMCVTTTFTNALMEYSCPDGYTQNYSLCEMEIYKDAYVY